MYQFKSLNALAEVIHQEVVVRYPDLMTDAASAVLDRVIAQLTADLGAFANTSHIITARETGGPVPPEDEAELRHAYGGLIITTLVLAPFYGIDINLAVAEHRARMAKEVQHDAFVA